MSARSGIVRVALATACAVLALAVPTADAASCAAAKLQATGRRTAAALGCWATAVAKGKLIDAACLAKAGTKFESAFAKADAKGGCSATGDAATVATGVESTVTAIVAALGTPGPSKCTKGKLLAAGKKSAAKHACYAKPAAKGPGFGVDPACLAKAETKFVRAFRAAETKNDCLAPIGDDPAIEAIVDDNLRDGRERLAPPRSTCEPIAATALHGAGLFPNARLARIVNGKVPCMHTEDLSVTKCRFSTAPGAESGAWLEGPAGSFAKTGQPITRNGVPNGDYVVAADLRSEPPPCVDATGMDTLGQVYEGYELEHSCTLEEPLADYNARAAIGPYYFFPLMNWTDGIVCSNDAVHPDFAGYVGNGGFGDGIYCYTGYGAALNDVNGTERDLFGNYLLGEAYCHYLVSGGFEVPAAKRPATISFPAAGIQRNSPIRWRPVNPWVTIANFQTPGPRPTPSATDTTEPEATPTETETPTPSPTVTPEPDFVVDTTVDDVALTDCDPETPADCSLRGALANAYGTLTAKIIAIPGGTYVLTATATCVHKTSQFGQHNLYDTTTLCVGGNVTLTGDGAASTIIDGNDTDRVMLVGNGGPTRVEGVTLRGGHMTGGSLFGAGGAINNAGELTLTDCIVTASSVASGGGGGIYSSSTLVVERSTISGNTAPSGGGIHTDSFNVPVDATIVDSAIIDNHATVEHGGGVFVYSGNVGGTTTIRGTTIAGNDAAISGGGIAIAGLDGTVTLTNSTVSGNRCFWYYGGGLADLQRTTVALRNVTVTGNRSEDAGGTNGAGGGVAFGATSPTTIANTIIAGNSAPGFAPDCYDGGNAATVTSLGYNLIGAPGDDGNGGTYCELTAADGDTFGEDPLLGALTDNGGPTATHLPAAGSPAIDTGDPNGCTHSDQDALTTDQRGAPRPVDGDGGGGARCDRGAVEVAP